MAKSKAAAEVASLNPDDFLAGGLKTDFRVRFTRANYAPWDYRGTQAPSLGVHLEGIELDVDTGEPLEDAKPWDDYWSAGSFDFFVPSEDGRTPAEGEEEGTYGEGPYALKVGKRPQLSNNTNYAHLMRSILAAGKASKKFGPEHLTSSLECLVGLDVHMDRVPQEKRSGMISRDDDEDEGGEKKARGPKDVLVVTKVYGYGEAGGKKAKAGKPAAKPVVEDDDDDDEDSDVDPIDAKLHAIVSAAIEENGKVKRGKLANIVLAAAAKDKDKSKMIARVGKEDFLEAGPWSYDSDSGILTAADGDEDEDDE